MGSTYIETPCMNNLRIGTLFQMIPSLILTACQPIWGYFWFRGQVIAFIVRSYQHFFCVVASTNAFLFVFCTRLYRIGIILRGSISPTDETKTGTTTPGQSESGTNDNEKLLLISQNIFQISST